MKVDFFMNNYFVACNLKKNRIYFLKELLQVRERHRLIFLRIKYSSVERDTQFRQYKYIFRVIIDKMIEFTVNQKSDKARNNL